MNTIAAVHHLQHPATDFSRAAKAVLENQEPTIVEVPGLRSEQIHTVCSGLDRFDQELSRSLQSVWALKIPRDPKYDEEDDGAIRKELPSDWKLFFHYRPDLQALLADKKGISLSAWQEQWFYHMQSVWMRCSDAFLRLAKEMDAMSPGYHFHQRAAIWQHLNCLRVLRYEKHAGLLAVRHTDRSALTFALFESSEGLRSTRGLEVHELRHPIPPKVMVFAGDQVACITSDGIKRCWHEVEDRTGGTEIRRSLVFFGKMYTGRL